MFSHSFTSKSRKTISYLLCSATHSPVNQEKQYCTYYVQPLIHQKIKKKKILYLLCSATHSPVIKKNNIVLIMFSHSFTSKSRKTISYLLCSATHSPVNQEKQYCTYYVQPLIHQKIKKKKILYLLCSATHSPVNQENQYCTYYVQPLIHQ